MEAAKQAAEALRCLGLSPKYKGYTYMVYMLCLSMDDVTRVYNLSAQLYSSTCERFSVNPGTVERNVRFAIRRTWEMDPTGAMRRLFQYYGIHYTPTNREFIAVLSDYIRVSGKPDAMQLRMW